MCKRNDKYQVCSHILNTPSQIPNLPSQKTVKDRMLAKAYINVKHTKTETHKAFVSCSKQLRQRLHARLCTNLIKSNFPRTLIATFPFVALIYTNLKNIKIIKNCLLVPLSVNKRSSDPHPPFFRLGVEAVNFDHNLDTFNLPEINMARYCFVILYT